MCFARAIFPKHNCLQLSKDSLILYLFQNKPHTYEHDIPEAFSLACFSSRHFPSFGGCSLGSPFLRMTVPPAHLASCAFPFPGLLASSCLSFMHGAQPVSPLHSVILTPEPTAGPPHSLAAPHCSRLQRGPSIRLGHCPCSAFSILFHGQYYSSSRLLS